MTARGYHRGHAMSYIDGAWRYDSTGELVRTNANGTLHRTCGHCGLDNTPEGHDACLGTLPGVMNACCGHGVERDAYVQFPDGSTVQGSEAVSVQCRLKQQAPV